MAFVDENGKIVVRVVYDGPAMAGKTTNVKCLSSAFRARAQSEVISVEQKGDRTRFLDWLQVDTGLVAGRHLSCHFMSVPGQRVLIRRREVLLRLADAVVFVCSAEPSSLEENAACYDSLKQVLARRGSPVPILVQINKQDCPEAVSERAIRNALGLDDGMRVLGASATTGEGVRETAVLALRGAADRVQNLIVRDGLDAIGDPPGDAYDLAKLMREEERQDQRSLIEVVLDARPLSIEEESGVKVEPLAGHPGLRLPHPSLSSGFIWPANDGRDFLRRATREEPEVVAAGGDVVEFDAGMWVLRTAQPNFSGLDEAREGLLRAVRRTLQLGELAVPQLVLCLTRGAEGVYHLWRVQPKYSTIQEQLDYGFSRGNEEHVEKHLLAYVSANARIAAVKNVGSASYLARPEHFSLLGENLYYLEHQLHPKASSPVVQLVEYLSSLELSAPTWRAIEERVVAEHSADIWTQIREMRHGATSFPAAKRGLSVAAS